MLCKKSSILSPAISAFCGAVSVLIAEISSEILTNLSLISLAALLVNVTANTLVIGICFPRMRQAILQVRTLVFQLPAPAMIKLDVSVWRAAFVCSSFSCPAIYALISMFYNVEFRIQNSEIKIQNLESKIKKYLSVRSVVKIFLDSISL